MSLKNWLNNGWLTEHRTSSQEITALLAVANRDLLDCETSGLSSDWQLNIAYNAALQTATAALAASGYRVVREAHSLPGYSISCSFNQGGCLPDYLVGSVS